MYLYRLYPSKNKYISVQSNFDSARKQKLFYLKVIQFLKLLFFFFFITPDFSTIKKYFFPFRQFESYRLPFQLLCIFVNFFFRILNQQNLRDPSSDVMFSQSLTTAAEYNRLFLLALIRPPSNIFIRIFNYISFYRLKI